MDSSAAAAFFVLCLLTSSLSSSHANLHRTNPLFSSSQLENNTSPAITTTFQVTKPIKLPAKAIPCASLQVLKHDFGFTFTKPPVSVNYTPPSNCLSKGFSKIVLEWKSTVKGIQFDRIFGVWLSGVEIFRSCTAEPTASGIIWTVQKDITRYTSLLMKPQTLAVYLGNLVNSNYTGVYHVNLTFHFYHLDQESPPTVDNPADLIIPISRNLPLNDGLWFVVGSSTDIQSKKFTIPQNSYRAVLEVYVSFHSSDEFWYQNPPNEYIKEHNFTDTPGNGPFREVFVRLDGDEVGAVWPFTVVFTGGFSPLLWIPITAVGSFDLPSYDIEITPFLGKILDGKQHEFGFGVTNALNDWYIDANLHIWLDNASVGTTSGELIRNENSPTKISLVSEKKDSYITSARRLISSSGWVKSSHGNITTNSFQEFSFTNIMTLRGSSQVVNQTIDASSRVDTIVVPPSSSSYINTIERYQNFPFYLHDGYDNYTLLYISLGFNEKRSVGSSLSPRVSSMVLNNSQQGQLAVNANGNWVGSTQQVYLLDGSEGCYFWNVSSSNFLILYNISGDSCQQK
ncbi:peptide-N4-(N-acetyl-beta-glucosaminyl)asparagine amidase A-like [Papaver somniferum]|uniref:peptide-N4-(N-acetyl-beta- glucosaminyl)asparagine amidase A-like n=1 Tax=Papaver somniferum TaxID=3469 RepID=UPI000E6F4715|nr:peptide-N4-(N-acetyl-beta-glucosaminyl)asparagine amidase A-like [Papaver somniferum]